jgi:hypothetical protein
MAVASEVPGLGGGGCNRWVLYGGAVGLALMVGFLLLSSRLMERGLEALALRARQRILQRLPLDLSAAERRRTLHNLERLVDRRQPEGDRRRLEGSFLRLAGAALADDRLTVAEVGEINSFLEGGPPSGGPTPAPEATAAGPRR